MSEDPLRLLEDLQSYLGYLDHLKIDGLPPVDLAAPLEDAPRADASPPDAPRAERPRQRPSRSGSHRGSHRGGRGALSPQERERPSFARSAPGRSATEDASAAPASRASRDGAPEARASGPTWAKDAPSATLPKAQKPGELLASLAEATRLPSGAPHLVAHGTLGEILLVEAIAPGGERGARQDPFGGRIGQMLGLILQKVLGVSPRQVCILQALEVKDPAVVAQSRGILEALVRGSGTRRVVGFGAYTEGLLLPNGGHRGEGHGRFGSLAGAQVLITHGLEEMATNPAFKRPVYQDLLEFQRRVDRGR